MALFKKFKKLKETIENNEENIKEIKSNICELKNTFDEIMGDALKKSKKYDEISSYLSNIQLDVARVDLVFNQETAKYGVKIAYSVKPIELYFDSTINDFATNEVFKSINMLNLISVDDMAKIVNKVNFARDRNK